MLSINTNIDSMVAQENLNSSQSSLETAITRLSSGKRINSAADDAAGLAISTTLTTQINGLNQGVSNANDATSLVQTASTGLSQITQSLQSIRELANEATGGTLSTTNQQALQQDVAQQIAEVNRLASQTTYNGINLLNGSAGTLNIQVGASVGQTVSVNLSQGVSAAQLGGGPVQANNTLGTITGLDLNANGSVNSAGGVGAITSINIVSNGTGGFTFTDQNNQALSAAAAAAVFTTTANASGISSIQLNSTAGSSLTAASELTAINADFTATGSAAAQGTVMGTFSGLDLTSAGAVNNNTQGPAAITSITVESNGSGGFQFVDQNGNFLTSTASSALFGTSATALSITAAAGTLEATGIGSTAAAQPSGSILANVNTNNTPSAVSNINVDTTQGANQAIMTIDNALAQISNIQATLGASQNRLSDISQSQQDESTDLSSANSQITDADFAQETAALSQAQVLQQAGISVLAQANSQPQQVLKLLQ
jgi:flagellin